MTPIHPHSMDVLTDILKSAWEEVSGVEAVSVVA